MALEFNSDDVIQTSKVDSGMGDFFPESGMRASDFRRMRANYAQNIAPLEERVINMQNNMMRLQSQDLAYKNAQLAYAREKEQYRLQSEYNDPTILNRIDEILDGDASALEQRNQIQEIGRENPQALLHVPLIGQAYQTALNQTKTRAEQEAKKGAPEKATRSTLANRLLQMPTSEANLAGAQLLRGEISVEDALDVIADQREHAFAAAKQEKQFEKKAELLKADVAFLKNPKTNIVAFEDAIGTMGDEIQNEWGTLLDEGTEEEKMDFMLKHQLPVRFDRVYRENLIALLDNRTSMTEKEIRKKYPARVAGNDMLLYKAAQEAVGFGEAEIVGVGEIDELYSTRAERDISEAIPIPPE